MGRVVEHLDWGLGTDDEPDQEKENSTDSDEDLVEVEETDDLLTFGQVQDNMRKESLACKRSSLG